WAIEYFDGGYKNNTDGFGWRRVQSQIDFLGILHYNKRYEYLKMAKTGQAFARQTAGPKTELEDCR
ncbi:hypothetical protein RF400_00070, partial [Acinetobacter baumannii]|nr:hypothetical protein [Acinetobacter baumannii]